VIIQAPAKINIEFEIIGRRGDGYHEVRTVMQTVDLCDYLTIEKSEQFILSGTLVAPTEETTMYKSVKIMEETFGQSFPISVHLDKVIPLMAGLGGGSSDAAATLYAINELYELKCSKEELMGLGASVGADVPFFIVGGKCLCEGIGEKVTPLPPDEGKFYYLIFRPHKRIATKQAYMDYDRVGQSFADAARVKAPQLDDVFQFFRDAVVSGKGPSTWVKRDFYEAVHGDQPVHAIAGGIESFYSRMVLMTSPTPIYVPGWDGDIYFTRPVGRR